MSALPTQKRTADYSRFVMHPSNRLVVGEHGFKPRKDLVKSMQEHGYLENAPIICEKQPDGQLLITDGHNRLVTAMALGLPVDYIAYDKANINPIGFSRTQKPWRIDDYVSAYVAQDIDDYVEIQDFSEKTGITFNCAACMFFNYLPASTQPISLVKSGMFKIKNREYPQRVGCIVLAIKQYVDWGAQKLCLSAIAKCVLTDGFNYEFFIEKVHKYNELLRKQPTSDDYIRLFEQIYNRNSKSDFFPLVAKSHAAIRARSII